MGRHAESITGAITRRFNRMRAGRAVPVSDLVGYGNRAAVDQALHRLVRVGFLVRLRRGVYARTEVPPDLTGAASAAWDKWRVLCLWNLPVKPYFTTREECLFLASALRKNGNGAAWADAVALERALA